jgi:D-lyxose ketol-isomerase
MNWEKRMQRSEINRLLREADILLEAHCIALPPWTRWSIDEWRSHPEQARYVQRHQMGWDVTDFGAGRFFERGLLLLCLRNGISGDAQDRPYAEKLMIVREGQETPFHFHKVKVEDIIVRGGGNLVVELMNTNAEGSPLDTPVRVVTDGTERTVAALEPIRLTPGESITLPRGLMHRFYGEPGSGVVLAGEVSMVNDDLTDNFFHEPVGRFSEIVEDEPPVYPLWSELERLVA